MLARAWHRRFGKVNLTPEIVRIENSLDVLQRVTCYGCGLRHAGSGHGCSVMIDGSLAFEAPMRVSPPRRSRVAA